MFCQKCGKEIMDEAVVCIHCGCAVKASEKENDKKNENSWIGLAILSFLIPIVGLIYWAVNPKKTDAQTCGLVALGGFIVGFSIISFLLYW